MVLDRTRQELSELTGSGSEAELESSGLLTFCEVEASQETIDDLRDRLSRLIEEVAANNEDGDRGGENRRYRLTLAFLPLDRTGGTSADNDRG